MKRFFIGSLCMLAGFLGPICSVKAAGYGCVSPNVAMSQIELKSERAGGNALRFYGDQAERFLSYFHDEGGRDIQGVIVGRYPALGYDSVVVIDGGCIDETRAIKIDPHVTTLAFEATFGASVNPSF